MKDTKNAKQDLAMETNMDDNFVWCALIFAMAYVGRNMLPSYYEMTNLRRHSLDNMRDDISGLEENVDAINNAVDGNEQTMLAMGRKLEELQSDVADHLTRLDDLEVALGHVAIAAGLGPLPEQVP